MDWLRISLLILGVILVAGIWIAHRARARGQSQTLREDADEWADEGIVHIRAHREGHEIEPTLGASGEDFERLLDPEVASPARSRPEEKPKPDRLSAAPAARPSAEPSGTRQSEASAPTSPEPVQAPVLTSAAALLAGLRRRLGVGGDPSQADARVAEPGKPASAAPGDTGANRRLASPYEDVSEPRVVGRNPLARGAHREKILVLHVVAPRNRPFTGVALGAALRRAGLNLGELAIYHYREEGAEDGDPLFSVANMVAPGTLTDEDLANLMTPGITLFLQLHACPRPQRAFELLLETSHVLARDLGGSILDAQQSTATNQTLAHMREEMNQWLLRHRPDLLRRTAER